MDELRSLKGVGEATLQKLHQLNIYGYADLVMYLPRDYMDFDSATPLEQAEDGVFVLSEVTVLSVSKPFRKGRLSICRAYATSDGGAKVKLIWYNSPYVSQHIQEGRRVRVCGKLKKNGAAELVNPVFELCGEVVKLCGVRPIYPIRGKLAQGVMQKLLAETLRKYAPESILSSTTETIYGLIGLAEAVRAAHCPQNIEEAERGRKRIVLEELVKRIAAFRMVRESTKRLRLYGAPNDIVNEAERRLPFALTPSQKEAVDAIIDTLKSDKPLNTMLAGDVGSGKTVVALLAAYYAVKCGYQAAVMAPTEILAVQHYNNFIKILAPLGIKTVLLCGSAPTAQKKAVRSALANGEADIAIGTQALFSKGAAFCRLGLAVIDEQHRFGVAQRTALIDKGHAVDTLTLSATPIPRSLRLTMFGDIDIKYIERRHAANNIVTAVVPKEKREAMLEYIVKECERGARAFLVAPRIEEDGESDLEAAEELFSGLQKKYGKRVVIGLIHGKRKPAEKLEAIRQFSQGTIKILVSTTVVEVGVDVPNASIMAVFGAERFGLATLHQLRGRIGRDGNKAYCFLYTEKNPAEQARLEIMTKENDGLAVAERDYKLRGAGDFLGESQSGRGFAGIRLPIRLVNLAARLADEIDTDKHRDLLQSYIERYALERVTLS